MQLTPVTEGFEVSLQISNTGQFDAEEVVQLYIGRPDSKVERPMKELKAFQRVALKAGESKTVRILVPKDRLRHWDETTHGWVIEAGKADVYVGSSSQDIRLNGSIEI